MYHPFVYPSLRHAGQCHYSILLSYPRRRSLVPPSFLVRPCCFLLLPHCLRSDAPCLHPCCLLHPNRVTLVMVTRTSCACACAVQTRRDAKEKIEQEEQRKNKRGSGGVSRTSQPKPSILFLRSRSECGSISSVVPSRLPYGRMHLDMPLPLPLPIPLSHMHVKSIRNESS